MSATDPAPPPGADPSMEDILASIRRILSEEEQPNPADSRPGKQSHRRRKTTCSCWSPP